MVDTAGSKTALDDLETTASAEDHAAIWYANIVEADVAVTVRGVVVAEHGQHTVDGDTGGVGGDEHDGLLFVRVGVCGIGFAHYDVDLAALVAGA